MGMMLRRYHEQAEAVAETLERPASNGSKANWLAYAIQEGHDPAEVEGLKRDDLAALFADKPTETGEQDGAVEQEPAGESTEEVAE